MRQRRAWFTAKFRAMGGPCEIRAWSSSRTPLEAAAQEIRRLEEKYSRYLSDSEITRINDSAGKGRIHTDIETAMLLQYAQEAWRVSDGMFDITAGVLRRLWDFKRATIPRDAEIHDALDLIGWQKIDFYGDSLALPPGMEIDFGGIVKEYAADRAATVLRRSEVHHALVDLAGDLVAAGPLPDGSPWLIRVRHPRSGLKDVGTLELSEGAVATSGDYERCIIVDGKRYSHILDPRTGWPVHGLSSATVRHENCIVAGTLTTVAILKGLEGKSWLNEQGVESICIEA